MANLSAIGKLTYYDYLLVAQYEAGLVGQAHDGNELAQQMMFGGGVLGGGALALQGGVWLYSNKGNYRNAWNNIGTKAVEAKVPEKLLEGEKNLFNNIHRRYQWQRIREIKHNIPAQSNISYSPSQISNTPRQINASRVSKNPSKKAITKAMNNVIKSKHFDIPRKKLNEIEKLVRSGGLKKPGELTKALNDLDHLINKANLNVLNDIKAGKIRPTGIFKKLAQKSGWNKVKRGVYKMANKGIEIGKGGEITIIDSSRKAAATRMAGKYAKSFIKGGGPLTFAIELGIEVPEVIQTYKQLGAGKGTKQLAKSTVKAGAAAAGWVVGAKVGALAGAKAGALIGSIFGPIGTGIGAAIGGALGGICGGIGGSWLAGEGAKKVLGKSELEKAKNNKVADDALEALNSPEKREELRAKFEKKAEAEGCDDLAVLKAYDKLLAQCEQTEAQCTTETQPETHAGDKDWNAYQQSYLDFNA